MPRLSEKDEKDIRTILWIQAALMVFLGLLVRDPYHLLAIGWASGLASALIATRGA